MTQQESIAHALEVWQPCYENALTQADGVEIVDTMTAYFKLVAEWVADVALLREVTK